MIKPERGIIHMSITYIQGTKQCFSWNIQQLTFFLIFFYNYRCDPSCCILRLHLLLYLTEDQAFFVFVSYLCSALSTFPHAMNESLEWMPRAFVCHRIAIEIFWFQLLLMCIPILFFSVNLKYEVSIHPTDHLSCTWLRWFYK